MPSKDDIQLKIVILGPDGAGKSSVTQQLIVRLSDGGRAVTMRHLKPRLFARSGDTVTVVTDPHAKAPRTALVSVAKILVWLMEEWYASLFQDRTNTLLICDRYYHDLLVDPKRYRYGGPAWLARFIGDLMPQPDLWVLLDVPTEVLQARKQEVSLEETARQRNAYRAFIQSQRNFVIVDADRSLEVVATEIGHAIHRLSI